ncbi:unnamed protein product [marine sediment metagenome]|uniref:Uncharacterized protein n=1 Tax=marine sediment metagenome TaxID=412755 RepID=X1ABW9_9ZZZZ
MSNQKKNESNKEKNGRKKAVITEFEHVKFAVILPEVETSKKAVASLVKLSAGGEQTTKKSVQALVIDDTRIPVEGPIPYSVWEKHWTNITDQSDRFKKHLAHVATIESGIDVDPEDIELWGTYPLYKKRIDTNQSWF